MKRLLALAAFLLASSAAQAQYTFEYGGRTIHIDPDRGTVSIPGVYDNTGRRSKRTRNIDQGTSHKQSHTPQEAKVDPQAPAAPAETATAPAPQAAVPTVEPAPPATTANNAPADTAALPPPPAPPAPPPAAQQQDAALQPAPAAAPSVVVLPAPAAPQPPPSAPAAAQPPAPPQTATATHTPAPAPAVRDPNSPVGVWLTEEMEGKVRIEQCGTNLCGYSVDSKSNLNGEQVLINMKPGKDQKWSGRILDPNTGSNYDSTIALKNPDTLRVQGCAFGGMFCGGQTWTRVN